LAARTPIKLPSCHDLNRHQRTASQAFLAFSLIDIVTVSLLRVLLGKPIPGNHEAGRNPNFHKFY